MNQNDEFLSQVLRRGSRAFAAYAARDLLESRSEATAGFEPDPFANWQEWLTARIEELAAAVAAHRPPLFASQILWGKAVLAARGIPIDNFRTSLLCLRSVLASELPARVRPLAEAYLVHALEAFDAPPRDVATDRLPDTDAGRLASAYLLTLLEGDRRRASQMILSALDRGHDVRDLYMQVLLPAQVDLGRMWLANEINVAEEHFASQTTKRIMAQLMSRVTCKPPHGKTIVAAAVAGNHHDIGLQAVADFFEMDGWRTILLGADVPVRDLVQAVDCFNADLLGLAASQTTQLKTVKATIEAVRSSKRGQTVQIIVGGIALADGAELARELGADGQAADPIAAVQLGNQIIARSG